MPSPFLSGFLSGLANQVDKQRAEQLFWKKFLIERGINEDIWRSEREFESNLIEKRQAEKEQRTFLSDQSLLKKLSDPTLSQNDRIGLIAGLSPTARTTYTQMTKPLLEKKIVLGDSPILKGLIPEKLATQDYQYQITVNPYGQILNISQGKEIKESKEKDKTESKDSKLYASEQHTLDTLWRNVIAKSQVMNIIPSEDTVKNMSDKDRQNLYISRGFPPLQTPQGAVYDLSLFRERMKNDYQKAFNDYATAVKSSIEKSSIAKDVVNEIHNQGLDKDYNKASQFIEEKWRNNELGNIANGDAANNHIRLLNWLRYSFPDESGTNPAIKEQKTQQTKKTKQNKTITSPKDHPETTTGEIKDARELLMEYQRQ